MQLLAVGDLEAGSTLEFQHADVKRKDIVSRDHLVIRVKCPVIAGDTVLPGEQVEVRQRDLRGEPHAVQVESRVQGAAGIFKEAEPFVLVRLPPTTPAAREPQDLILLVLPLD
jgi:hypothetical protein